MSNGQPPPCSWDIQNPQIVWDNQSIIWDTYCCGQFWGKDDSLVCAPPSQDTPIWPCGNVGQKPC